MNHIFDAHFHIIDYQFPLINMDKYQPPEFTVADYVARIKRLNIKGGAIVSASFQGFDQTYLTSALRELGPSYVGVTQLPATVSDSEIMELNNLGVRAVRFNLKRGGSEDVAHLKKMADRIYQLAKWHVELYVDSTILAELANTLILLPKVSIDHLGLSHAGFKALLKLVEKGVKVKATGFGRVDFDVKKALVQIASINPKALMFGTDLPSTRAKRPFLDEDINIISDTFDQSLGDKILFSNAIDFYNLD